MNDEEAEDRVEATAVDSADSGEPEPALELTAEAADELISATVGQAIAITLQTIGPGHYADPEISSVAVRFIGMEYPRNQNPGGPRQVFTFRSEGVGSAAITIPHTVSNAVFTTTIVVE